MDLSKLTPAPWEAMYAGEQPCVKDVVGPDSHLFQPDFGTDTDAEFIALAREAFDVMIRREWWAVPRYSHRPGSFWIVRSPNDIEPIDGLIDEIGGWPDPFTALVEADKWYKENVENKQ